MAVVKIFLLQFLIKKGQQYYPHCNNLYVNNQVMTWSGKDDIV